MLLYFGIIIIFLWILYQLGGKRGAKNTDNQKHILTLIFILVMAVYYHQTQQDVTIQFRKSGIVIQPVKNSGKSGANSGTNSGTNSGGNKHKNRVKRQRGISQYLKKLVASAQNWKCNMCGQMLGASFEVDHIRPLHQGGSNSQSNLQALCRNCHGQKTFQDAAYL